MLAKTLTADLSRPCAPFRCKLAAAVAASISVLTLAGAAKVNDASAVPDFSGPWALTGNAFDFALPRPGIGPGPLVNTSGDRLVPVGNYDSPLLKPWAAAEIGRASCR